MNLVLWLLLGQCVLGAFDSFWHHEITERLPQKKSARRELKLHASREFLYGIVFLGLAWRQWLGLWAWGLAAILIVEIWITLADFVEEDRTRNLPKLERVVHTILAINFGIWLAILAPQLFAWSRQATALAPVDYGVLSILLTVASIGVFAWSLRNAFAILKLSRPPAWVRNPLYAGKRSGRTVLVTGATGFIGSALVSRLLTRGDAVIALVRDLDSALDRFGPHIRLVRSLSEIEASCRIDAVVNLAGAPILALPWTRSRRQTLLESRVGTTNDIVRLCQRLTSMPRVLVSGSAIGYYGVRADEDCLESTQPQSEFQSQLCRRWEHTANAAETLGIRVVNIRTGIVLGKGGALPRLAMPVRLFVGAIIGSGRQWISWIHLDDMIRLIEFAIDRADLRGAVNATAPQPVRHRKFQRDLADTLHRPLWFRIPAWALRSVLGEMSTLLVDGQRVLPHRLQVHGFQFRFPTLKQALRSLYSKSALKSPDEHAEVFYNGECPVCNFEMSRYAKLSKSIDGPLCFVDSIRAPDAFLQYGLRKEHLEERLYVRDSKGRVLSGVAAIAYVWKRLPRFRWAARIVELPGIKQASDVLYDLVVAPSLARWARQRMKAQPGAANSHS